MCAKCVAIDEKVERYRFLASRILDSSTIERIESLVADLLAIKGQLHPA